MIIKFLKQNIGSFSLLIIFIFCFSCKSNLSYSDDMKIELKRMYDEDQNAQKYDIKKISRKEYSDSIKLAFDKLCAKNLIVVKKYFDEYGFPGIKENGKETSLNFWLIVQHGDHDVNFQNRALKAMKKQLDKKNVNARNYAYLYDRVKKNQNKPQLYGTQMVWDSLGIHRPYKLKCQNEVNLRREKMGLGTIEDYIKEFN